MAADTTATLGTLQQVRTVCAHDCPDACSILVTLEAGRVVRTDGDPDHPFTQGFLCGKVNRYAERVHSPDRLARRYAYQVLLIDESGVPASRSCSSTALWANRRRTTCCSRSRG